MPRLALLSFIVALGCASKVEEGVRKARPILSSGNVDVLVNSIGMKLKRIPAGNFLMGALPEETDADKDERPQHRVSITRPFYLGVYEVTQHEYKQVMGDNPSHFRDSDQQPVEQVSWPDAVKFCNKLSEREGRKPYYRIEGDQVTVAGGNGYRLPTEAEEEYYASSPATDPPGAAKASHRVFRGGCWDFNPWGCRPAVRRWFTPEDRDYGIGFRVAAVQE